MNAVRTPSSGPKYADSGWSRSIISCMSCGMEPSAIAWLPASVSICTFNIMRMATLFCRGQSDSTPLPSPNAGA